MTICLPTRRFRADPLPALLLGLALALSNATSAQAVLCEVPLDYPTVQEAIDEPTCDPIRLPFGITYNENLVIWRSLVLEGTYSRFSPSSPLLIGLGPDDRPTITVRSGVIATLRKLHLSGNDPSANAPLEGGVILNEGSQLHVDECLIASGEALQGGGIANQGGIVTIENSLILGNSAKQTGGGIHNDGGSITLLDTSLYHNRAGAGGGIYQTSFGASATLERSALTENTSSGRGAGAAFMTGTANFISTGIDRNVAGREGGGLYFAANKDKPEDAPARFELRNVTLFRNQAQIGGGIHGESRYTLLMTALGESTGNDCTGRNPTSLGFNVDEDGSCFLGQATDLPSQNPQLAEITYCSFCWAWEPKLKSPLVDAGTNAGCPALDQRRSSRPNWPFLSLSGGMDPPVCDIGAVERRYYVAAPGLAF